MMVEIRQSINPSAKVSPTARILGDVEIEKDSIIHDFVTLYPNVIIGENVEVFECAVIGRPPRGAKAISRKLSSQSTETIIENDCVISPHATIYFNTRIGEGTLIGDGASIREQSRIGKNCIISRNVTVNYNTKIGDYTKIMDSTHITGNMIIGSNVFISTMVATTNDNNLGSKGYNENLIKGPIIEDNVAIGAGANILPGVRIGAGSIVGAGSVVTKDIPEFRLVMGIPARVIKELPRV